MSHETQSTASFCPCGQNNQDPHTIVHFTHIGCDDQSAVIDPWHYTGDENFHADSNGAVFIKLCKDKLPKRKLPIRIGSTGYVNCDKSDLTGPNGWCFDDVGRIVILIDGELIFQRMIKGHCMMRSTNGITFNEVTSRKYTSLTERLTQQ